MKIEAGKYYQTQGGDVVGPMARYAGRDDTFTAIGHTWYEDGSFVRGNPCKMDLISEVYVSDTPFAVKETEDQLREMMRDPRYWRTRDPEYVKRVTDGFRAVVGGGAPPVNREITDEQFWGNIGEQQRKATAILGAPETKTLRDEFAMAALRQAGDEFDNNPPSYAADWAYQYADAMMEARKK